MNKNIAKENNDFKVGDYITYCSEKHTYNGTILDVSRDKVKIQICVSCKKAEDPLFEEIEDVELSKIKKRF